MWCPYRFLSTHAAKANNSKKQKDSLRIVEREWRFAEVITLIFIVNKFSFLNTGS
jgi:hypothetical protein